MKKETIKSKNMEENKKEKEKKKGEKIQQQNTHREKTKDEKRQEERKQEEQKEEERKQEEKKGRKLDLMILLGEICYILAILLTLYMAYIALTPVSMEDVGIFFLSFIEFILVIIGGICLGSQMHIKEKKQGLGKISMFLWLLFYIMVIYQLLLGDGERNRDAMRELTSAEHFQYSTQLIPFRTISEYLKRAFYLDTIAIRNIVGNIVLCMPFGFLLPCLFKKMRKLIWIIVVISIVIIFVELGQYFFYLGTCDIDDLILNVLGAVIAYGVFKIPLIQKLLKKCYLLSE